MLELQGQRATVRFFNLGVVRKSWLAPVKVFHTMGGTLLTAFGMASSLATLPFTTTAVRYRQSVDRRITDFVLPLGASINMDGTAIYLTIGVMTIAQLNTEQPCASEIATIAFLSFIISFACPGVPTSSYWMLKMSCKTFPLIAKNHKSK